MTIRHNARFYITWNEARKPFKFHLTGFGSPKYVKESIRLVLRDRRRQIMLDPQQFVVNLFCRSAAKATVELILPRWPNVGAFTYHIDLLLNVPTIEVTSHITGQTEQFNLFAWVGPQRRISKVTASTERASSHKITLHKRRGRPTILSEMQEPLPDRYK